MDPEPSPLFLLNITVNIFNYTDYILLILLLILFIANAIVSGSAAALFSLKPDETKDISSSNNPIDYKINRLLQKPEKLLTSLLIAHNTLNIFILVALFYLFQKVLSNLNIDYKGDIVIIILIFVILLIFNEFIPKLYASSHPLKFLRSNTQFTYHITKVFEPFAQLMVSVTKGISGNSILRKHEISMDELTKALEITSNEIEHNKEKDMLEGIIRFKDKVADDILIDRYDVIALDITTPFNAVIDFIVEAGYSRIPVYEADADSIKGILYVKDLLPHLNKNANFHWQSLIRQAYFVPGTKRIDDLLEEFRTNKNHMAIVVDEYGGTTGIVTMEDILEEIIGDISDEYDEEKPFYTLASDGTIIFDGKTSLDDFFRIAGIDESEFGKYADEADTLAGIILEIKGNFPKRKEIIEYKDYKFQIEEMTKRRIVKIRYTPLI